MSSARPGLTLSHMGRLCKALFLLLLAFEACGCGKAQASCSSAGGGMNCRAVLDVDEEAAAVTPMGALNITVPPEIAVPSGSKLLGALQAVGHQHYKYNGTAWVLYNATAWLYEGEEGANMSLSKAVKGTHFFLAEVDRSGGQPSWQLGSSRVTAKSVASVSVDSDSIKWNLLQASSYQLIVSGEAESSSTSWATFVGDVSFVQRLHTQRGLAPAATHTDSKGDTFSSVYSALYAFYTTFASPPPQGSHSPP